MRVHNLVEDLVIQKVEEMFAKKEELSARGICVSQACQLDVICYVLNRLSPQYVVSGRGVAHSESGDYTKRLQMLTDMTILVQEGMEIVSKNKRERGAGSFDKEREGSFFNFPSIIGRLLNGLNYAPIVEGQLKLMMDGELAKVIDPNWQNPYVMVKNTAGTYLFWPHPIRAEKPGIVRSFQFALTMEDQRFEPFHYFFDLTVTSEPEFVDFVNTTSSFRIKDLSLFPKE